MTDSNSQLLNLLRPPQLAAVRTTYNYFRETKNPHSQNQQKFLWNAKPRFGKTLAAYAFAEQIQAERILIITNRPAIADSWARDFFTFVAPSSDYIFSSQKGGELKIGDSSHTIISRTELIKNRSFLTRPLIFFISLQDLKGKNPSNTEIKAKNRWIFDVPKPWDLVILDEVHDGMRTAKSLDVFSELRTSFTLHLSGTPFRAVASHDFSADQIFNYTYLDEQKSQQKNLHKPELSSNSLPASPRLDFRLATLPNFLNSDSADPPCYDFSDFFAIKNHQFTHPELVSHWLTNLAQTFTSLRPALANDYFHHTFWLMSGVAECEAMKNLLSTHPAFQDYQIILATGKNSPHAQHTLLHKLRESISPTTKTITLSCGQLTTGITIPEWTAVVMLYNASDLSRVSSAQYLQAAFRAQNPCRDFDKPKAFIFDFLPARALTILQDYATNLCDRAPLSEFLRYADVQYYENSTWRPLSPSEIKTLPSAVIAREIVDGNFVSSSQLFRLENTLNLSPTAAKILQKLGNFEKGHLRKRPTPLILPDDSLAHTILNLSSVQEVFATENLQPKNFSELSGYHQDLIRTAVRELDEKSRREIRRKYRDTTTDYRAKLRGFSHVVPLLLHLYGEPGETLDSLPEKVPDAIFEQLTNITKSDFQLLLRENYFHRDNFNAAIAEFLRRKDSLKNYYATSGLETIWQFIPPQPRAAAFTPARLAVQMVDLLERQSPRLFRTNDTTFFDPASKSGLYLAEIARRLYQNTRKNFSSDSACLEYIFSHQLYTWSPDPISHRATLATLFDGLELSKLSHTIISTHFLEYNPSQKGGPMPKSLSKSFPKSFDVIIGNPPYQDGRRQVYADFYRLAVDLDPDLLCMVFPTGWQKVYNHNGLGQLNSGVYKRDPHLVSIDNYPETGPDKFFPDLNTGGVNIVLRSRKYNNHGHIQKLEQGIPSGEITLPLTAEEIEKPTELTALLPLVEFAPKISTLGSARKPYGFHADPLRSPEKYHLHLQSHKIKDDDLRLYGLFADETRGYKYIPRTDLPKSSPNLDSYKLFVPKAWGNMSARIGLGGSYANICVASPGDVCAETFIEFGPFRTQAEASHLAKYFMTKFFRALLFLAKDTQNTPRDKYRFVPIPNLSAKEWQKSIAELDELLFAKYQVPKESREFIRTHIQPRTEVNIEIL